MFFYITHDLLPSMLLFILGFGLVCLAAAALLLVLKGAQKLSEHSAVRSNERPAHKMPVQASARQRFNSATADMEVVKIGDMEAVKMGRFSLRT